MAVSSLVQGRSLSEWGACRKRQSREIEQLDYTCSHRLGSYIHAIGDVIGDVIVFFGLDFGS